MGRGEVYGRQSFRIQPDLVYFGLIRPYDISVPAIPDHQAFSTARVRVLQGKVENTFMRFLYIGIFREYHTLEIGGQTGIAEFLGLHFPESVRQDEQAVRGPQVFQ